MKYEISEAEYEMQYEHEMENVDNRVKETLENGFYPIGFCFGSVDYVGETSEEPETVDRMSELNALLHEIEIDTEIGNLEKDALHQADLYGKMADKGFTFEKGAADTLTLDVRFNGELYGKAHIDPIIYDETADGRLPNGDRVIDMQDYTWNDFDKFDAIMTAQIEADNAELEEAIGSMPEPDNGMEVK